MLKFLADVNVEKGIIELLRSQGLEVKWVVDLNKSMEDKEVLKIAEEESRILLTNDKDFGGGFSAGEGRLLESYFFG